ncbi:MAG TPA: HlyD family efflux transporter periplasmic adaptor subunit [Ramlibacter sp.]|uniref:HlyD family efflux transporter periplasmic adaptor subunit n=1 Tax=Ramlibacter sp. TaxID=1917967 RepID=UPI002CB44206|nr:HlyD family efflux transporter periplasmic adaptor subunit [Ramlibacter sp.]HVZ42987.1 HlyD family efflux transporter periplasmic adaptor subunit [Ramlibacter sp.]
MVAFAQAATVDARPRAWPALREDLRLHHGPALHDGQPSWTLQDPVRHRFVRIDWVTYEVLRCWWLGEPDRIAEQVNAQTTLSIGREHVLAVYAFARQNELVEPDGPAQGTTGSEEGLGLVATWLLHHYLFFRIPLLNPDRFLQRMLPWVVRLGSGAFLKASLAALVVAIALIVREWPQFRAQAVDLISWRGLLLYGVTLIGVKIAHEFGHAFAARYQGCRVPTMGVAFMVMWPVAYTDTSEAWRLADARARLKIALAGVRTELTIAAWALLAWSLLPEGPLRTAAFILGTLTWVTTVLINLSPFMRFDGYFVACDLLDMPNLHGRAFAMARWWLRRTLIGWVLPAPEPAPASHRRAMVAFAIVTWAYRFALYMGIAWLVYRYSFKALGLFLFAVEIGWFIVLPVWREFAVWGAGFDRWRESELARRWRYLGPAIVLLGAIPVPAYEGASAVLQPLHHLEVRLPSAALIEAVHVREGDTVRAGMPLLDASSAVLQLRLDSVRARVRQLQAQLSGASVDSAQQAQWSSLQEQLAGAREEEAAVVQELAQYHPLAPFDGQVLEIDPGLRAGLMASPKQTLMQLAAPGEWRVVAYASEAAALATRPGDRTRFIADAAPLAGYEAVVVSVSPHPAQVLAEPMLAQPHGGGIAVTRHDTQLLPVEPLYRVELDLVGQPELPLRSWRGHVRLEQPWRSLWGAAWTALATVLTRELGF